MTNTFAEYRPGYSKLLKTYKIRPQWSDAIDQKAKTILGYKDRYSIVSSKTGVPWAVIGVIHNLESDLSFTSHLHNGDPLDRKTTHIPKGRPLGKAPFTWEDSAVDALTLDGLNQETDWSDEKVCYNLEKYNGFGYRSRGVNSPYLWSGTTVYTVGKYTGDNVYSSTEMSHQIGGIPLYKRIIELEQAQEKEKAKAAVSVLKEQSRSYKALDTASDFAKWATGGIGALSLSESLGWVQNFMTSWKGAVVLGSVIVILWTIIAYTKSRKTQEFLEGRYIPSGLTNDTPKNTP